MSSLPLRGCALLLCVVVLTGCAFLRRGPSKKQQVAMQKSMAEARSRPLIVGRVTLVDTAGKFVLIDATSTQTARAGTIWRAYSGGALAAELRATGVRRRPWVIADIVRGEVQVGDMVLQPAEAEPATAPKAEAVTRTEPVAAPVKRAPFWKRWLGFGRQQAVQPANAAEN